jgi:cytoskeletal protein CcmA (bactofilin family)
MFGKRQQTAASSAITVIAAGSIVEGTLRVRGMVQVDGTIDGTLIADGHVSVGPEGRIVGEVNADQLSVGGKVEGKINARTHLHVLASGAVRGTARYTSLEIERGGVMDGNASRVDDIKNVADNDVELVANAAAE